MDKIRKGALILLGALFLGGGARAQQGGGFRGPGAAAVTAAEAKKLRDHTPVVLRGNILRFLGDEKYLFQDASGKIVIEIDDNIWNGLEVHSTDTVEIVGEIDKDLKSIEVEVSSIRKI
ncbi:MAG: NirD/YgiW/YdeI family stress tolerance protein [Spirochaetaceae bacterium]|jgi:uncharacterized protein (TIGR00156 family)|nr:NirD/YgiW/YdeI family stress tolerance protein [Spirochaetaceae bacterium]